MKRLSLLLIISAVGLAALACASLPALSTRSQATATPSVTATPAGAETDLQLGSGLIVGSLQTTNRALSAGAPFLESLAKEQYDSAELSKAGKTYTYTVAVRGEQTLIWQTNWCTTTEDILKQNLEHIQVEFVADGEVIDPGHIAVIQVPGNSDLVCTYFIASVSQWPEGDTLLEINVTFTEAINDGLGDYAQGTHTYRYEVNFHQQASPTLAPRATAPSG
jgi:hypothetical protein